MRAVQRCGKDAGKMRDMRGARGPASSRARLREVAGAENAPQRFPQDGALPKLREILREPMDY